MTDDEIKKAMKNINDIYEAAADKGLVNIVNPKPIIIGEDKIITTFEDELDDILWELQRDATDFNSDPFYERTNAIKKIMEILNGKNHNNI